MPGVIEKTDELVEAIQQSKQYEAYNELKNIIADNSEVKKRIDSFRSELLALQLCDQSSRDDFEKLRQEYKDIFENSRIMEFLSAEQALIEMLRDIYDKLGNAVTLDLSFLGGVKELNI